MANEILLFCRLSLTSYLRPSLTLMERYQKSFQEVLAVKREMFLTIAIFVEQQA
jgi:hypothetical protein